MKKVFTAFFVFLFPSILARPLLRLLGHTIGKKVKIGFSIITSKEIILADTSRIGHFNLILNDSIILKKEAYIGYLNILKGPYNLVLEKKAAIGNKNYITRAAKGITYGEATLHLGILTKVTVSHHLDLTRSITFDDYSILAGIRSQMWTHGFYHAETGKERIRIDGEIHIGKNVYIGSGCIFNPGVRVGDAIHIGGGSVVSKDLLEQGMYVGQALRYIKTDYKKVKAKLQEVKHKDLKYSDIYEK